MPSLRLGKSTGLYFHSAYLWMKCLDSFAVIAFRNLYSQFNPLSGVSWALVEPFARLVKFASDNKQSPVCVVFYLPSPFQKSVKLKRP
jgi:hypothetical protein